jgi:hypothetical protein
VLTLNTIWTWGSPLNRNREEACEEEHEEKSCAYFAGLPTISSFIILVMIIWNLEAEWGAWA